MPRYIAPFGFIFFRVFISTFLFFLIYIIFYREKIDSKDYFRFFACGFFGIALNQLMFFKGISQTSAIHGSLLMITTPIITYIISTILYKQKFRAIKLGGISLGMAGAAVLILSGASDRGNSTLIGDLFVVVNAISFSIYLVLVKPLMNKYSPLTVIFLCFLTGSIWVGIAGWQEASHFNIQNFPIRYYPHFLFVILGATFIVYLLNIIAIRTVSATTVSSFMYLQPLFAIAISILFAGEKLSFYSILGGILIIFGLWLINKKSP